MATVKFKRKTEEEINNMPIEDGSIIFDITNKKMYLDNGTKRLDIGGGGLKYKTVILQTDNWVQNETTQDYEYIIEDSTITRNYYFKITNSRNYNEYFDTKSRNRWRCIVMIGKLNLSGGGLDINGIIKSYKVTSGGNVNAGDFVKYINNYRNYWKFKYRTK